MKTSILLAEDHPAMRQSLRTLLEAEEDFNVIGEAGNGKEAIDLAERLQPDVLTLDLSLPDMSGLMVALRVRQCSPRTRIIIVSSQFHESYVIAAREAGADGYVPKNPNLAQFLPQAVREVITGRRFFSPQVPDNTCGGITPSS